MPQVTINLNEVLTTYVNVHKAKNNFKSKEDSIKDIIEDHKNQNMEEFKNGWTRTNR